MHTAPLKYLFVFWHSVFLVFQHKPAKQVSDETEHHGVFSLRNKRFLLSNYTKSGRSGRREEETLFLPSLPPSRFALVQLCRRTRAETFATQATTFWPVITPDGLPTNQNPALLALIGH